MNAVPKRRPFPRLGLLLFSCSLSACRADTDFVTQNWPVECVGRMQLQLQLQLPGPADTAAFTYKRMLELYNYKSPSRDAAGSHSPTESQRLLPMGFLFLIHFQR